ncbi:hypothetical protein ACSHT2_15345 [Bradyrhizobium sp. PUT101]|uniref:hypothetical protein n=1 Tax=Bradyrhizobium sp. PUT101 TaxID=3447427 RepID=UPI003F83ECF7
MDLDHLSTKEVADQRDHLVELVLECEMGGTRANPPISRRTIVSASTAMLEAFEQELWPVHIVYTERKPAPLKLRAFLDWATPRLKARLA